MAPIIDKIVSGLSLCEAPYWDVETQSLYFVDKSGDRKTINRYHPERNQHTFALVGPKAVDFLALIRGSNESFIAAMKDELVVIQWDGETEIMKVVKSLAKVAYEFNDGKVDPAGRLWGGTQNVDVNNIDNTPPDGTLYCLHSRALTRKLEGIRIANGLVWNLDINKFYYIDSLTYGIDWFDYDNETGTIGNRHQLFSTKDYDLEGMPDGMAIDADGNLWVAMYKGNKILKIDGQQPGVLLDTIDLTNVTSLCFGGPNLDALYVTFGNMPDKLGYQPEGGVYKITNLGVKGLPMERFVLY